MKPRSACTNSYGIRLYLEGDPANKILLDASVESGVLYFVFPDTMFDINQFAVDHQADMAASIQQAAIARFKKLLTA